MSLSIIILAAGQGKRMHSHKPKVLNLLAGKPLLTHVYETAKKIKHREIACSEDFEVLERNEESLGEIFCFFILETILLGRALKVNPFDQPSVELIKKETKKVLLSN